jgi:hypothetical protein
MKARSLALVLVLLMPGILWAEDQAPTEAAAGPVPAAAPAPAAEDSTQAIPGAADSRPSGLTPATGALPSGYGKAKENGLRRFEILAFGSFPILLFYTNLGFEIGTYAQSGFDPLYAPWPFSGELTANISDSERFGRMGVAAGLSLLVAGIDAVILASRKAPKP